MNNKIYKIADIFYKLSKNVYWGKKASGVLFICFEDETILLLKRSRLVDQGGDWGVAGGAINDGFYSKEHNDEDPDEAIFLNSAQNEVIEELGSMPKTEKLVGQSTYRDEGFTYETFIYSISLEEKQRWTPTIRLNWENDDSKWFKFNNLPQNLHFGLKYTLNNINLKNA